MKQFHKFNSDFVFLHEIKRKNVSWGEHTKYKHTLFYTKTHHLKCKISFLFHFKEEKTGIRANDNICFVISKISCSPVFLQQKPFRKNRNIEIFDFLWLCFCIRATTNRYCFQYFISVVYQIFVFHTSSSQRRLPQP